MVGVVRRNEKSQVFMLLSGLRSRIILSERLRVRGARRDRACAPAIREDS